MIRLIGSRIIVPQGDTGIFMLPLKDMPTGEDVAVFSVKDIMTKETVIEKNVAITGAYFAVELKNQDTKNLSAGKYIWDIKMYHNPVYDDDGIIIDAMEINSYYSAFKQPLFIIKEVAKDV